MEGEAAEAADGESVRKRAEALRRESKSLEAEVNEKYPDLEDFAGSTSMRFELQPEAVISVPRKAIRAWSANDLTFKDATVLEGLLESAAVKLEVDEIDLQAYFARQEHGGTVAGAEAAAVFRHLPELKDAFVQHRDEGRAKYEANKAEWRGRIPVRSIRSLPITSTTRLS